MDDRRERLYGDREIGALIQRATEIQEQAKGPPDRGITLQQVERIATEIGIPAEHVRAAALDLDERLAAQSGARLWGGPFHAEHKRVVEGALTEDRLAAIARELSRRLGGRWRTDDVKQTREWTREVRDGTMLIHRTQVVLSTGDDRTTVEVRKQYKGAAILAYSLGVIGSVTVAGIAMDGAGLSDLTTTWIVGGSAAGGLAAARTFLGVWTRRQREKLRELANWLNEAVAGEDPPRSGQSG